MTQRLFSLKALFKKLAIPNSLFVEKTFQSNILINVHKDEGNKMKWKSGTTNPKSVVITDFGISTSIRVSDYKRAVGTAGWAPPEQWLGDFLPW